MKADVRSIMKESGTVGLFTDSRFLMVRELMKYGITKDPVLKAYLSIDPYNKAQWIADHIKKLVDLGKI